MPITLLGVDPTTFNVTASLLAEALMFVTAYALDELFRLLLSFWLRRGKKVPAKAFGRLPGDMLEAIKIGQAMKWAAPAKLIFLLFLSDYSTTIAFAGLGFELVETEGPEEPVLSLKHRNDAFPYQTLGEPLGPATRSKLEVLLHPSDASQVAGKNAGQNLMDEIEVLAAEEDLVSSFIVASDAIARGESPFLVPSRENLMVGRDLTQGLEWLTLSDSDNSLSNTAGASAIYGQEDSFLAAIETGIPLQCGGEREEVSSDEEYDMATAATLKLTQVFGDKFDFETSSAIPNCTFTSRRSSGIYGLPRDSTSATNENDTDKQDHDDSDARVKITAMVSADESESTYIYLQGQENRTETLWFPPNGLRLARDRLHWREGRTVFGFGGLRMGETNIPFGVASYASGSMVGFGRREYIVVAQVDKQAEEDGAGCPLDPSKTNDSTCLVVATLECNILSNDEGDVDVYTNKPGQCIFKSASIIWGKNFVVDQQLVSAVAGVFGRNSPWALSLRQRRTLAVHAVPAALFSLGTLESRSSVKQVKSTTIDGIFIAFMAWPAILCITACTVYFLCQRWILDIPDDGYKMFVLGCRDNHNSATESGNGDLCNTKVYVAVADLNGGVQPEDFSVRRGVKVVKEVKDEKNGDRQISVPNGGPMTPSATSGSSQTDTSGDADKPESAQCQESVVQNCKHLQHVEHFEQEEDVANSSSNTGSNSGSLADSDLDDNKKKSRSCCRLSTEAVLLFCSVVFCVGMAILSAGFILSKSYSSNVESSSTQPIKSNDDFSEKKESTIPAECFKNRFELVNAVYKSLDGTEGHQDSVRVQYGNISDWCLDHIDDISFLFAFRPSFSEDISAWDVSAVVDFSFVFASHGAKSEFTGDLSEWDVSSGKKFKGMFLFAAYYNSDMSAWDFAEAEDLSFFLSGADDFNQSVAEWDVSGVKTLKRTFHNAQNFEGVGLENWDTARVQDFSNTFMFAQSLKSNVLDTWDVSSGELFDGMISWTHYNGDLGGWNVSKGMSFSGLFMENPAFNGDISSWDVSSATSLYAMFDKATSFATDISSWDVSNVVNFERMFQRSGYTGNVSNWDVGSGLNFNMMFMNNGDFAQDLCSWIPLIQPKASTRFMFHGTSCPFSTNNITAGHFCHGCAPTPMPSAAPSASPTTSQIPTFTLMPTVTVASSFNLTIVFMEAIFPFDNSFRLVESNGSLPPMDFGVQAGPQDYYVDLQRGDYVFELFDSHGDGFVSPPIGLELYLNGQLIWRVAAFGSQARLEFSAPLPPSFAFECLGCNGVH